MSIEIPVSEISKIYSGRAVPDGIEVLSLWWYTGNPDYPAGYYARLKGSKGCWIVCVKEAAELDEEYKE